MPESHAEHWHFPAGERFVRSWLPANDPTHAVAIVHGLGDHSGRFAAPAEWLQSKGVAVFALDQIGHGKSPGRRVCIPSYDALLDDVEAFLSLIRDRNPHIPLGLFGQSMGGNVTLNYALQNRPHAQFVVAGSPMLRSDNAPGPIMNLFARGLLALAPNLHIPAPVILANLAHDEEVQQQYLQDPLVEKRVSLRLGAALIDTGKWALDHADQLPYSVLIMHGTDDKITSPVASQEFVDKSNGKATLRIWEGGRHDLHLDIDREAYMETMWEWIVQVTPD